MFLFFRWGQRRLYGPVNIHLHSRFSNDDPLLLRQPDSIFLYLRWSRKANVQSWWKNWICSQFSQELYLRPIKNVKCKVKVANSTYVRPALNHKQPLVICIRFKSQHQQNLQIIQKAKTTTNNQNIVRRQKQCRCRRRGEGSAFCLS